MKTTKINLEQIKKIISEKKEMNLIINELNELLGTKEHKGVLPAKIIITSENCWTSLIFPQWTGIKTDDTRYYCDSDGNFLSFE